MSPIAIPPRKNNGNGTGTPDVEALTSGNASRRFEPDHPLGRLTPEQIDEIGLEFQKIHDEVRADLGEADATYIRSLVEFHRRLAALSRIVLLASRYPPAWILGTAGLSVAKILENMELGHNIMHGQWDWMNDPNIHSSVWDWTTSPPRRPGSTPTTTCTTRTPTSWGSTRTSATRSCASHPSSRGTRCTWRSRSTTSC